MLDKKIIDLLKPIRVKYFIKNIVSNMSYAFIGFSAAMLILMLVSKIIPITFVWNKILIIGLGFIIITLVWSTIKRPSFYEAGKLVDSMGLKERVVTSLELSGNTSSLANIQKQDTIEKLNNRVLVKNISLKPPTKVLLISIILIIVSVMVGFIRTPSYDTALKQQKNKELIEKEKENIEKVEKQITEDKKLSAEEKEIIEKRLEELRKQLDKPKDLQGLQKEILKAQKEIDKLKKELIDKEIKKIADKLADKEFTKELAKRIEAKDPNELASEIQKMTEQLENASQEELKKIAEEMKALAQELSENQELAKAFKDINNAISQNINQNASDANLSNSMNNLQQALSSALSNGEASQALTEATNALNQLSETVNQDLQLGSSNGDNQGNGQSQEGSQGNNGNSGNGGAGSSQGSGQGQGQGSGNGQSQGTGGGAGSGTSPGNENSNGSSSSGGTANKDGSEKQIKEYEKLFTPKNIGGEGSSSQIHSNMNDAGSKDGIQIKKFGDNAGESVPYDEVLDSYKLGAYKKLDSDEIPESMKELIREYFSELD